MKQVELVELIEATLRLFAAEEATEEQIEAQLIVVGAPPELARQLVVFVPSAFGRAVLQRFLPEFPDTFLLMAEDGTYKRLFLADEPVFTTALAWATDLISTGAWTDSHQIVAEWSAEVGGANALQNRGNSLTGLRFTEAVITSEIGPRGPSVYPIPVYPRPPARQAVQPASEQLEQPNQQGRPWWKFW